MEEYSVSTTPNFDVLKVETEITPNNTFEVISNEELKEILESNEIEALNTFKNNHPELVENKTDIFVMLFIWARKLDLSRTKELLENHYKWRQKYDIDNLNLGIKNNFFFTFYNFFFTFFFFFFLKIKIG